MSRIDYGKMTGKNPESLPNVDSWQMKNQSVAESVLREMPDINQLLKRHNFVNHTQSHTLYIRPAALNAPIRLTHFFLLFFFKADWY